MHHRLTIALGLVACALAGTAPAIAGDPGAPTASEQTTRTLHPKHTSGGEPGTIAAPLPAGRRTAIETTRTTWSVTRPRR